jgi:hypothetical protein
VKPEQSQKISDVFVKSNLYYLGPLFGMEERKKSKRKKTQK